MLNVKALIRKINNLFIIIVLFFFYFIVIGFAHIIYKLFVRPKKKKSSYWEGFDAKGLNISCFQSPY
jgi:formate/nitrite transporter FocA (FNT family)